VTHQKRNLLPLIIIMGLKKTKCKCSIKNTRLNAKFAHDNLFKFTLLFTE